ncbi:MAG: DUF4231 domain-containing protein [Burkholderiaceae bacterium]
MSDEVLQLAENTISGFKAKANHNKKESLVCFTVVVTFSLASPLFVTLGESVFWGKILPSILSLSVAASTAWLQLRKPQNLWSLYRDCQRRIEDSLYKYRFRLAEYEAPEQDRARLLAEAVRAVAWDAHQRWLPLVPTPDAIGSGVKVTATATTENEHGNQS